MSLYHSPDIKKVLLRMSACRIHLSYYANPIEFYVKTMSAEGSHLGWRSGSVDTILKIDHLRTIHAIFALTWLTGFRGEDFKTFFPIGSYVKTTVCLLKVAILDGGQDHWTQF